MAQTFDDCWRTVRLYASTAPVFLVREWVHTAYKQLAKRRNWAFLRGRFTLSILASRSITTVVTQGSATVTSAGAFLSTDAGRQFRVGTGPIYTIQTVTDANTILLDSVYTEPDAAAATALIQDVYATMPADFGSFRIIADPYNQRRLAFWVTEDQLSILDPDRRTSDSGPRALVAASPSPYLPTLGRIQYEYWPRPTAARSYPAMYNKQADRLVDGESLTGVLGDAAEVLIAGALAQAAAWPGTTDLKNPYFNLPLAQAKAKEFEFELQQLSLKDDAQYPDDLASVHWERWPLADLAYNDHALRASDATVEALW